MDVIGVFSFIRIIWNCQTGTIRFSSFSNSSRMVTIYHRTAFCLVVLYLYSILPIQSYIDSIGDSVKADIAFEKRNRVVAEKVEMLQFWKKNRLNRYNRSLPIVQI